MNTKTKRTQTRKNNNFTVSYNSMRVNDKLLTRNQTKYLPHIHFKPKKGNYYTIIMYDLHSPYPAFLHYMAINVTDPSELIPFLSYYPPSPPSKDMHYHVYVFELYEQPGFLTLASGGSLNRRTGFDPEAFAKMHGLRKLAQRGFYINPQSD